MTYAPPSPWQLYGALASPWSRAGASPFDCVEAILEMLAVAKRGQDRQGPSSDLEGEELTVRAWEQLRHELTEALDLPEPSGDIRRFFERMPGLLEQTRRSVAPVFPILATPVGADFARGLLDFLAHAPQTGMRHTPLGYFKWPEYLAPLLRKLIGKPDDAPLYCPLDSSGWMPLLLAEAGWRVHCELANTQAARVLMLFAYVAGWNLQAHVSDPIRQPSWLDGERLCQFKHAAAITNFGMRMRDEAYEDRYDRFPVRFHYGETIQVAHLIAHTKGRLVVIVPEAFLFRTSGGERDYKEHLIRRGMLSVVIRLPRNAFASYANVQSSILIFETEGARARDVLFVDATSDLNGKHRSRQAGREHDAVDQISSLVRHRRRTPNSAIATYDEIAAQEFNISVDRYVRSEEEQQIATVLDETKTLDLTDIADIIRPQAESGDETNPAHTFAEVGLQDIQPDGSIRQPKKLVPVNDQSLAKAMRQQVEDGDVLLSVRGRIGAVGIVPERKGDDGPAEWLASQAFVILRLRNNSPITPLILYRYLSSPLGQGLLQSLATGMTVPMVSMGDVKKLRVMIPTAAEQREIEKQYEKVHKLRTQIRQLEKLADDLNSASWPMTKVAVPAS